MKLKEFFRYVRNPAKCHFRGWVVVSEAEIQEEILIMPIEQALDEVFKSVKYPGAFWDKEYLQYIELVGIDTPEKE